MPQSQKIKESEQETLNDPQVFNRALQQFEAETKVLLLLPEDLYSVYQPSLKKRLLPYANVVIAKKTNKRVQKFDCVLSYHDGVDFNEVSKNSSFRDISLDTLFKVQGVPPLAKLKPIPQEKQTLTPVEKKFLALKKSILAQEKNQQFFQIAYFNELLRYKSRVLKQKEKEIMALQKDIAKVEKPYYRALSYILLDAVKKMTAVGDSVESLMKSLMKILIVDDLQENTINGLMDYGFNRKYLSTMTTSELQGKYNGFLKENLKNIPLENLTIKDFLVSSHELDQYEIILINFWRFKDNMLPVQVRIKKKTIVSKKEQRQLEKKPQALQNEIKLLKEQQLSLQKQLKEISFDLEDLEALEGTSEGKYQAAIKKRKRIVRRMQKTAAQLKNKQTLHTPKTKYLFYSKNIIQTFREHQPLKERIEEKIAEWQGVGNLLKGYMDAHDHMKSSQLIEMLNLSKSRLKIKLFVDKLGNQIEALKTKTAHYAQKNNLWNEQTGYQSYLDHHALKKIECAVLGSFIAQVQEMLHVYRGSYFSIERGMATSEYAVDLSKTKIYIATQMEQVPTVLLQQFFQISKTQVAKHFKIAPELPTIEHFEKKIWNILIIDQSAFVLRDIWECLKARNQSSNSHIPVVLFNPKKQELDIKDQFRLHLMMGLPKNVKGELIPKAPSYEIASLSNQRALFLALTEVMGVPRNLFPSLESKDTQSL